MNNDARQLIGALHAGGQWAYWWTAEGRKSTWWEVGRPGPLPGGKRNVYVGVHPLAEVPSLRIHKTTGEVYTPEPAAARALIEEICSINCLFAEFDAKDFNGDKAQSLAHIRALPIAPTILVDSGGGYHAYWVLAEPWVFADADERRHAAKLQAAWVTWVSGDAASKDLARVLRVPGTYNYKYDPPRLVAVVEADYTLGYDRSDLESQCAYLLEDDRLPAPAPDANGTHGAYVTAALAGEIAAVVRAPDGLKHKVLLKAATSLGELVAGGALAEDEVVSALESAIIGRAKDMANARDTIHDGLSYGAQRPRTAPQPAYTNGSAPATAKPTTPAPVPAAAPGCPALPAFAQEIYAHLAPCGAWLDAYIGYAAQAAPMTPAAFHEAAGLFAVSMAIARRLALPLAARPIYPNLYLLFIAPSTVHHKSTGFGVLEQLIGHAGLTHLLMPQKAPPEAFVNDLDPYKLPTRKIHDMDLYLDRRAFAPQRGYLRDEVSALFAGLRREFNAGLLELILSLYECPTHYDETTISRGDAVIANAYLTFFGASTPIEMGPYLAHTGYWSNGLWARFALIIPDQVLPFVFFPPAVEGMDVLANGLRHVYQLFPIPQAELVSEEDDEGHMERHIVISGTRPASPVQLATGVWTAWERYSDALHQLVVNGGAIDQELNANYGRFGTMAIKVAMLLAAMDASSTPITVELRHFARAQQLVEGWRVMLHRVWAEQAETNESRLIRRIVQRLSSAPSLSLRDLCQALRSNKKDTEEALSVLAKAAQVECCPMVAANGRTVEQWRLAR